MRALTLCVDELTLLTSNDPEQIVAALENLFHPHSETYGTRRYCINVKVHSLPLTWNQQVKALHYLEDVWDLFIRPWIHNFQRDTGQRIYTEGRCGGYMYIEEVCDVMEPEEMLDEPEDDDSNTAREINDHTRERLRLMLRFKHEWETLLKDIKNWLNTRPLPSEEE